MAPVLVSVFGLPEWQADSDGYVYRNGEEIHGWQDRGYTKVCLSNADRRRIGKKQVKRAFLVCTAWHGPAPFDGAEVLHKDDDRTDDSPDNLYWGTHGQNTSDAWANGRMSRYGKKFPAKVAI